MNSAIVFQQMLVIVILFGIGYICHKKGKINPDHQKCLSWLTVNIFNPALVLSSVVNRTNEIKKEKVFLVFLIAFIMFFLLVVISKFIVIMRKRKQREAVIIQLMYIFSNLGFIGIPVVRSVLGNEYVFFVSIFVLEYTVLLYTYGVNLVQESFSIKTLKSAINIGTISAVAALILFFGNVPVHSVLKTSVEYLGDVATPLALIVTGASLETKSGIVQVLKNRDAYMFSIVKLLILPLVSIFIMRQINLPQDLKLLFLIMFSMPVGSLPLMLLTERGWNTKLCSDCIMQTTLLAVVTIPLMVYVFQMS